MTVNTLDALGGQFSFYLRVLAASPRGLRRHWRAVLGHLAGFLPSGVAVAGVTAATTGFLSALAAPGAAGGLVTALAATREVAPLTTAVVLSLTVGCRLTAELGAARASREDETLEAIGARAVPHLVTARLAAALLAVLPLYAAGLFGGYAAGHVLVNGSFHPGATGYDASAALFVTPTDVLLSAVKTLLLGVIVLLVHCYHGFAAGRGPAGAAPAVALALRSALVAVVAADAAFALAFWAAAAPIGDLG